MSSIASHQTHPYFGAYPPGKAGIEALVRWQHPRKGLLHPRHFLHAIEEHDLLAALTDVGQVTKGPAPIWFIIWLPVGLVFTMGGGWLLKPGAPQAALPDPH